VHTLTAFPARRFGFTHGGSVAERMKADTPTGIRHVLVNGRFGVRDGEPTGERAGRFAKR